jgi:DNA-binding NarL/FixJ family response regulator
MTKPRRHPSANVLLIVEDDALLARGLSRFYGPEWHIRAACDTRSALEILNRRPRLAGAILDIRLPDGSGLDVLRELRRRGYACPALVLTALFERHYAAEAQLCGAEFLAKPARSQHLRAFGLRLSAYAHSGDARSRLFVQAFAQRLRLSPRETEIVALALADFPRDEILDRLGITPNTLKTHVRVLLRKTETRTLAELARRLRREMDEGAS